MECAPLRVTRSGKSFILLFGSATGALTGAIAGGITPPLPAATALWIEVGSFLFDRAASGAVIGTGSGATTGYAGGTGGWEAIMTGTARGAAIGGITGAAFGAAGIYAQRAPAITSMAGIDPTSSVLTNLVGITKGVAGTIATYFPSLAATASAAAPYAELTALSVGIGMELTDQVLSREVIRQCATETGCIMTVVSGSLPLSGY